jgi:hypothetical protein
MLTSNTWRLTASPESSEKAAGAANAENPQVKAIIPRLIDMNPLLFVAISYRGGVYLRTVTEI